MLVHFPIASWTAAVAADLALRLWHAPVLAMVAFGGVAGGLVTGLPAMALGLFDYAAVPAEHPAQGTAATHMMVMGTAWLLFLASLLVRRLAAGAAVLTGTTILDITGFVVMLCGARLGGTLVYRFGVGVRERSGFTAGGGGPRNRR